MPGDFHAPKIAIEENEHYEVTDEYLSVGSERPTKLKRTYDKLGSQSVEKMTPPEGQGEERETKKDKGCALEGKVVVFTWDEKAEEYEKAWNEGEKGDDDLLEGLAGDMDLLGFLPGKSVAEGDSWDVDAKAFNGVFQPAGILTMKTEGDDNEERAKESRTIDEQMAKSRSGKAKAKFAGTREEGGVKVGVIEITAKLEASALVEKDANKLELSGEVELDGELCVNLKAGQLHSLKLIGKMKAKLDASSSMDPRGRVALLRPVRDPGRRRRVQRSRRVGTVPGPPHAIRTRSFRGSTSVTARCGPKAC
jgi:hypothetical protein